MSIEAWGLITQLAINLSAVVGTYAVLGVATGLQERRSHTDDGVCGHVGKVEQDLAHSNHLTRPLLVTLVLQSLLHGNGLGGNLVSLPGQCLDLLVVAEGAKVT